MDNQRTVWERYVTTWLLASAAEKRSVFEACLAPQCVYCDPLAKTTGWDELLSYMSEFQRQLPGAYFVTEYFLAHHGRSIARWKMMSKSDAPIGEGISYGEYDAQGRLVAISGFFDSAAAVT